MKKLKKFKRFSEGGLGSSMGAGTPNFAVSSIETDEGYKREKEQGAKNLESIKNFFMGRRSKDEASAPIEERKSRSIAPAAEEAPAPAAIKPEPAKTDKVETPRISRNSADDTAATSFDYPPQREHNQALEDAQEQKRRAMAAFKPAAKPAASKPAAVSRDAEKGNSRGSGSYSPDSRDAEKGTSRGSGSYSPDSRDAEKGSSRGMKGDGPPVTTVSRRAKPEDIPSTEASKGPRGEEIDNSGRFTQAAMALPPVRGASAGVRGALTLARLIGSSSKSEGAGTGKVPEAKSDTVSAKPAVDRVKDAKIEGPPVPPKPKSATEEMGLRDTPSMVRMREAKASAKEGPPEPLRVKTSAERKGLKETPSMERMRKAKEAAKEGPPAPAKTKTPAEEMGLSETSAMEKSRKANEGPPDLGARSRRVAAAQKRSDAIPAKDRDPGFMKEYIAGRADKRNRIKDLPNDGLSAERYANKKGGKIPAFKKGGLVGRGDGCAMRGKTKGRMV